MEGGLRSYAVALLVCLLRGTGSGAAVGPADGASSRALHAELTQQLVDWHLALGARPDWRALTDELWGRFTAHHADFDAADKGARRAFERSAAKIVELNARTNARGVAGAVSRAPGAVAPGHSTRYGFTRMSVIDEVAFAARLAAWRPLPAGLATDAPVLPPLHSAARGSSLQPTNQTWLPRLAGSLTGELPELFDWSGHGVLSGVKDQRECGACWSFTTVQTLEAAVAVVGGALMSLSAQQLLDCDQSWNQGCVGGNVAASIGYLKRYGAMREDDYPYRNAASESCRYVPSLVAVRVAELMRIPPSSEQQLQHALLQFGPLAVSVDAAEWQHYTGGVIEHCADAGVNHAVQLVGWGATSNGIRYWNIRNSWSAAWGELGYARLLRGVDCNGIIDEPAYTFAVAGQECLALDCSRCVGEWPRCGWCDSSKRCEAVTEGAASCKHGWLDAMCQPAPPPPRGLTRSYTCGIAAAAATGQPAPYLAFRLDRTDWRQGSACVLGFELSATQGLGGLLMMLTFACWLLQALASCWCCPDEARDFPPRPRSGGLGAAAQPLLLDDAHARSTGQARVSGRKAGAGRLAGGVEAQPMRPAVSP